MRNLRKTSKEHSKFLTGAIVSLAFVAGYVTNSIITPQHLHAKENFDVTLTGFNQTSAKKNSAVNSGSAPQSKQPQRKNSNSDNLNRPAKSGILRYYTKTSVETIGGKKIKVVSKYAIKESEYLLHRELKDINTGKTLQTEDYDSYISFPMKTQIRDKNGVINYAEFYDDFSDDNKCPVSGKLMQIGDDGDKVLYTISYKRIVEMDPEPKQEDLGPLFPFLIN